MSSHIRRNSSLLLLALIAALALAACGGGGTSSADVPEGAVAVVGDKTVTKEEFDQLIEQQKKSAEAQKQDFPGARHCSVRGAQGHGREGLSSSRRSGS